MEARPVEAEQPVYAFAASSVLAAFQSSLDGLVEEEAVRRQAHFGPNRIAQRGHQSALLLLLHEFRSPVVYLLAAAAGLAVFFGELEEAAAIGVVLILNALIGFATEIRAVRSMEALRAMGIQMARVRRSGMVRAIEASGLVPGDIVLLEAGDAVGADLRLIEAHRLAIDESMLTGESATVEKSVAAVAAGARLAERTCMLFKGTMVTRGAATALVVAIGGQTELGRISGLVEAAEPERSPLERRLERLSGQLIWVTLAIAVLLVGIGVVTGNEPFAMVEAAIALAVAAIPEGMPIVATLALARGMLRLARRNALIERLSAVETLGATTVILTDKTGTLTENRMAVRRVWMADGGEVEAAAVTAAVRSDGPTSARALVEVAMLCNGASLGPDGTDGTGDPMELALLRFGRAAGLDRQSLMDGWPMARVQAFETETRMMATVHCRGPEDFLYAVKGAPEAVMAQSTLLQTKEGAVPFDADGRRRCEQEISQLARSGLRVIALAGKTAAKFDEPPYDKLTLFGLVGLEDPPRADVPEAIRTCRAAGIKVVMVTGDHAATARSIGHSVGLCSDGDSVIEGRALARLQVENPETLLSTHVFARVDPAEKFELVRAFQQQGEIVAMTGDGVNDAPALRQADIGVAMGLRGTDVARQAAAMVLLDDAFPTIVAAVREGRVIYGNIRRFVTYLLSCNLSEVLVVGLAITTTLPLPLLPLQILYLNLVTDIFPAFALAMGRGEPGVLQRPPRDPRLPLVGRRQWRAIAGQSAALAAATLGAMGIAMIVGLSGTAVTTVSFLTLAFSQLWHVFNMRGHRSHPFRNEITANPWVWVALAVCAVLLIVPCYWPAAAQLLGLEAPDQRMWALVAMMSLAPRVVVEVGRRVGGALHPNPK